jgi:hypothetical protein
VHSNILLVIIIISAHVLLTILPPPPSLPELGLLLLLLLLLRRCGGVHVCALMKEVVSVNGYRRERVERDLEEKRQGGDD